MARVVEQLSVEGVIEEERKPDILRSLIFNFTKIFLFHGIPYLHFHCKIKWIFCLTSFWKYQTFANICKLKSKYLRPLSYSNYKYPSKILFQLQFSPLRILNYRHKYVHPHNSNFRFGMKKSHSNKSLPVCTLYNVY